MRNVILPLLLGAIGALFHLLPTLGATSLTDPNPLFAYTALAGTVVFLGLAFSLWTRARSAARATGLGLLIGFGYFSVTLHWLGESVVPDAASYSLHAALTALGGWTLLYPWWAIAFGAAHLLADLSRTPKRSVHGVILFSVLFSIADVLVGDIAFRIPLSPLSASLLDTLWQPLLTVTGQHGSTAILVALSASLALSVASHGRMGIFAATAAICVASAPTALTGISRTALTDTAPKTIFLAQPNPESAYSLALRGDPDPDATLMAGISRALARGAGADLIVLPEGAIPHDLAAEPEIVAEIAAQLDPDTTLIAGFRRSVASQGRDGGFSVKTFNTAYGISGAGEVLFQYDKAHLVPFGEYMPDVFYDLGFSVIAGPTIEPGQSLEVFSLPNLRSFSVLICYEGLLSGPVSRETGNSDWFLNISSEGLFGQTIGPRLLLQEVRLRSAETGIPMLRSASTGFTAVIDSTGSVLDAVGQDEEGGIWTDIPAAAPTLFRQIGYWPLYATWIAALGWVLRARLTSNSRLSFQAREDW